MIRCMNYNNIYLYQEERLFWVQMNRNLSQEQKMQQQYIKSCIQNDPFSLTMLKSPMQVIDKIYSFYNCVCLIYWPIINNKHLRKDIVLKHWIQQECVMKVIIFEKDKQLIQYLNKIQEDLCVFLVCQVQNKNNLNIFLKEVVKKQQIKLIILFSQQLLKINEQYHQNSKKIKITSDCNEMIKQIENQKKKSYKNRQAPNTLIPLKNKTQSQRIYVDVIYSMLNQQVDRVQIAMRLEELIKKMPFDQEAFSSIVWKKEIQQFTDLIKKKMQIEDVFNWYTRQTFVFSLMGKILRFCYDPRQVFYIQPYFIDLYQSIQNLYKYQERQRINGKSLQCFRGGKVEQKQILFLKSNIGQIVQNRIFLSTSKNQSLEYVYNIRYRIKIAGIQSSSNNLEYKNAGFACIKQYSIYPLEEEVLFNPLNYFIIKSLNKKIGNDIEYHELELQFIDMSQLLNKDDNALSEQQKQIKDFGLKELSLAKSIKCQGDVLSSNKNKYLQGSFMYWSQFLNNISDQQQILVGLDHLYNYQKETTKQQEVKADDLKFDVKCNF